VATGFGPVLEVVIQSIGGEDPIPANLLSAGDMARSTGEAQAPGGDGMFCVVTGLGNG